MTPEEEEVGGARHELRAPWLAWPTLVLLLVGLLLWGGGIAAGASGQLHLAAAVPLVSLGVYTLFTVNHDAAHHAVSRVRWINGLAGRLASLAQLAPFVGFRWIHLAHHRHTNDPARDPHWYVGQGAGLASRLWHLATADLVYPRYVRLGERPRREALEFVLTMLGGAALLAGAALGGSWLEVLVLVVLPQRLATFWLSYSFDYLPHRPHDVTANEDRYRASNVVSGRLVTAGLLCQNYHLVHHLYPSLPFYRYPRVWQAEKARLVARGARVLTLWGAPRHDPLG